MSSVLRSVRTLARCHTQATWSVLKSRSCLRLLSSIAPAEIEESNFDTCRRNVADSLGRSRDSDHDHFLHFRTLSLMANQDLTSDLDEDDLVRELRSFSHRLERMEHDLFLASLRHLALWPAVQEQEGCDYHKAPSKVDLEVTRLRGQFREQSFRRIRKFYSGNDDDDRDWGSLFAFCCFPLLRFFVFGVSSALNSVFESFRFFYVGTNKIFID